MKKLIMITTMLLMMGLTSSITYGQCEACQMRTQTSMQTWVQQSVTMRYSSYRTETISAQCIGAAIDAFIAAGGFNNWAVALPEAFDAYKACDSANGGMITARQRRMDRREIFRQIRRLRSTRTASPVRILERVRMRVFGRLTTGYGGGGFLQRLRSRFRSRYNSGSSYGNSGGGYSSMQ